MIQQFIKDKNGLGMFIYYFLLMAVTLMFIFLYFNYFMLTDEKSMVDLIADEAVTAAARELYTIAYEEITTQGTITDRPEYRAAIKTEVENYFSNYNKNATITLITISNGYLTIEGYVTNNNYKSPDYIDPSETPVELKFKSFAVIRNVY